MNYAGNLKQPRTVSRRTYSKVARLGTALVLLAALCSALLAEETGTGQSATQTTSDAEYARQRSEWKKLDDEVDSLVADRKYEQARDKARDLVKAAAKLNKQEDGRALIAPAILSELERVCELDSAAQDRYAAASDRREHGVFAMEDLRMLTAYRELTAARRELGELVGTDSMAVWEAGSSLTTVDHTLGFWIDRKYWTEGAQLAAQQSAIALKMFGKSDPQYGGAMAVEASFQRSLGNHAKALELDKGALRIRETFFGTDHALYTNSTGRVGIGYAETGNLKTGRALLKKSFDSMSRSPAPDAVAVAAIKQRLARASYLAGELGEATQHINEGLKLLPDNSSTYGRVLDITRVELLDLRSTVCERQGDKAGAAAATEEANKIREVVKAKISR